MTSYPQAIKELTDSADLPPLDAGNPSAAVHARLSQLDVDSAFAATLKDRDMAACCISGLWLLHGYLDESHKISQEIESTTGSYWHGIMHRRESDYGNAKYWLRRVGRHAIFARLETAAQELARSPRDSGPIPSPWDPFWFVDFCDQCARGPEPAALLARRIQQQEWELLFDYCYHMAVGLMWS